MRWLRTGTFGTLAIMVLVATTCGRVGREPSAGGDNPVATSHIDQQAVGIYTEVIERMAGTEPRYDEIAVYERPCQTNEEAVPDHEGLTELRMSERCGPPLTTEEQAAILDRLEHLPRLRFVGDWDREMDRIFEGTGAGSGVDVVIRFAAAQPEGDRVEIYAEAFCGGLCGHGMTLVVDRTTGHWTVTGTTGEWIS
jgi:hypothetical protein